MSELVARVIEFRNHIWRDTLKTLEFNKIIQGYESEIKSLEQRDENQKQNLTNLSDELKKADFLAFELRTHLENRDTHIAKLEQQLAASNYRALKLQKAIDFYMDNGGIYPEGFDFIEKLLAEANNPPSEVIDEISTTRR